VSNKKKKAIDKAKKPTQTIAKKTSKTKATNVGDVTARDMYMYIYIYIYAQYDDE
jgi:hypothetical protein